MNSGAFTPSGITFVHVPTTNYATAPYVSIMPLNATTANALPYLSFSAINGFKISFGTSSTSTGVALSYNYMVIA
jgi:hypothetical protein